MKIEHDQERIDRLVAQFNGAIKYTPMLQDHPDWTDEQCLAFARKWHAVVIDRLRPRGALRQSDPLWNNGIPYCRNIPTQAMLDEAAQ